MHGRQLFVKTGNYLAEVSDGVTFEAGDLSLVARQKKFTPAIDRMVSSTVAFQYTYPDNG
jgi:hypothetical protein